MSKRVRGNIFALPEKNYPGSEIFETLATGSSLIERIISYGHSTPDDVWYDQERDEWVILLQGEADIMFEKKGTINLTTGDYLFIPSGIRHKVTHTSESPPCIWIAVHGKLSSNIDK